MIGTLALLVRLTAPAAIFSRAKVWGVAGMTVGFGLWFFGFLVIAGEYFASWQSKEWNGQEAAFRIAVVILGVLVFVSLPMVTPRDWFALQTSGSPFARRPSPCVATPGVVSRKK